MTKEEKEKQLHLAEMMLAQCNNAQLQIRRTTVQGWRWEDTTLNLVFELTNNLNDDERENLEVRIKPDPREWWICESCSQRGTVRLLSPHLVPKLTKSCSGKVVHVREVIDG